MAEPPLAEAKKSLEVHETSLGSLLSIQEQISSLYSVTNVITPRSHRLSNMLETSARAYQARIIPGLKEQIDLVQAEKEETEGRVRILEAEVDGLRLALDQAEKIHGLLLNSLPSIGEVYTVVSKALMPISRVPAELWTAIFKLTIHAEVNYDMERDPNSRYRNTVVIFLHVCRFWRDIVMNEPQLWAFAVTPSTDQLSRRETSLLDLALGRAQSRIALLARHDRLLEEGEYNHRLGEGSEIVSLKDKEFGIIIDTNTGELPDYTDLWFTGDPSFSVHPAYTGATSVTLKGSEQLYFRSLLDNISFFWRMKTLTLISRTPLPGFIISIPAGPLTTLTLVFRAFGEEFPIYLNSVRALIELHIRHEVDQDLPRIQNLALSQLQILGITAPAINFLKNLEAPRLERLIYYGPMDPCKVEVPIGDNGLTKYRRLASIEFEDWKDPSQRHGLAGAVGLFRNVLLKTHSLSRVTFTDSFVDGSSLLLLAIFGIGDAGDRVKAVNRVEEVTLNRCSGIPRNQCDLLKARVKKLNIYV